MFKAYWNILLPISTLIDNATIEHKVTYNDLIEKTIFLIRSCTVYDSRDAVLIAGEYREFFQKSVLRDQPVALIAESKDSAIDILTINKYTYKALQQFSFLPLLWKLKHFVVVASSQPLLRLLLQRIRDSTWANFNGFHVLIDRKTEERGCANAYRYLWTSWKYDLLYTLFLCIDPVEGLLVFTYSPYSNMVPEVWQDVRHFKGRRGHPWILLKRRYQDDLRICEDLIFDKTTNLNGYEVTANAITFAPYLYIDNSKQGLDKFTGDNSEILKIVFNKLNVTLNVLAYNGSVDDLGGIGSHGKAVGILKDVSTGKVDLGMNVRSLHAMWKLQYTYPHSEDGLCVITQPLGEIAEYMKILSFMSPTVMLGNATVLAIALLLLAKHTGFFQACLNIMRLITFVSMRGLPQDTSHRIFFSTVFLLCFTVNALLQCHWSSLLTVPVPKVGIRSAKDLKRFNYKIYGSMFYVQEIYDPVLWSRFHGVNSYECKQQVLRSRYSACLGDCLHLDTTVKDGQLHSSSRIRENVQVYVTRESWPLFDRVTEVIGTTVEAGLVTMWRKRNLEGMYVARKRKQVNDNRTFRNLEMRHISFSFYILLFGYSCATIVFVVEFGAGRCRARQAVNNSRIFVKL